MKLIRWFQTKIKRDEKGQAMMLIALAFIGLVAFIGLAIDAGIVFAHIGHLRRGVDAAALSAANQIRQTTTLEDIKGSAEQLILLNLPASSAINDLHVVVETCDVSGNSIPDCGGSINRKLARVQATLDVHLAFLPMIGWDMVPLTAEAISEAASIDLVLVIDNSTSMAYDASCNDGDDDDGDSVADDCPADPRERWPGNNYGAENPVPCPSQGGDPYATCLDDLGQPFNLPDDYFSFPSVCNFFGNCQPFQKVRAASKILVNQMFTGYDQIALVTFNKFAGIVNGVQGESSEIPTHEPDLNLTINKAAAIAAIDAMTVYPNFIMGNVCSNWVDQGDPRGCMRTNHAAGLMLAGRVLDTAINPNVREESVKVVVLLSDGLTNTAYDMGNYPWNPPSSITVDSWLCPPAFWRQVDDGTRVIDGHVAPFCTDGDPETGYNGTTSLSINDDPDNLARRFADYLGCLPDGDCAAGDGLGVVIFTIGLGQEVANYTDEHGTVPSAVVGEELLRYIARVGFNGVPEFTPNSPCWGVDNGTTCGNYYYAPAPEALPGIFSEIADRIFTRLTH